MILLSPYSKPLRNGAKNAKDYPYWKQVISMLSKPVVQIGVPGEEQLVPDFRTLPFPALKDLVLKMDFFISGDNFFPHFCHYYGKKGIVVFSKSDPNIFGYPENVNLLKDRSFLRPDQFGIWEQCPYDLNAFISPEKVAESINAIIKGYYS